ncbi:hypothetical protein [Streptomyces sp. NPDC001070]
MSRRTNRRRRIARPMYGGFSVRVLSLPARLHVRWLVILAVMVVAMGAYARVLMTAPAMPPGKAPTVESGDGRAEADPSPDAG